MKHLLLTFCGVAALCMADDAAEVPQWLVSIHANTDCRGHNLTRCAEVFSRAVALGFTGVRTDIFWEDLEPTEGGGIDVDACAFYASYYSLAESMGLEPLIILGGAPQWAKDMVLSGDADELFFQRLGAYVDAALKQVVGASGLARPPTFQLWNEMNDPITNG